MSSSFHKHGQWTLEKLPLFNLDRQKHVIRFVRCFHIIYILAKKITYEQVEPIDGCKF